MEQCRTAFKSDQKFTASRGARPCDLAPYTWCIFLFGLMTIALFWDTLHTLKKKKKTGDLKVVTNQDVESLNRRTIRALFWFVL